MLHKLLLAGLALSLVALVSVSVEGPGRTDTARAGFPFPTLPPFGVELVVNTTVYPGVPGDGLCSLDEAINAANINGAGDNNASCNASLSAQGGTDGISFDIGSGTPTINIVTSPLPGITGTTGPVAIDGATGGATRVVLHGPGEADPMDGLYVGTASSSVYNMVISNFAGMGIYVAANNVIVRRNYIGTDAAGSAAVPNRYGIFLSGANAIIGGTTGTGFGGACAGDCNLISGNGTNEIYVSGAAGTVIRGNFVGTDVTGMTPLGTEGIHNQGSNTTIGGTAPGAGNIITYMDTFFTPVTVQGNYVGVNSAGTGALAGSAGIYLQEAHTIVNQVVTASTLIGGADDGAGNVISGSITNGITVRNTQGLTVLGNRIGTTADGSGPIPNTGHGIRYYNASKSSTVGGTAPGEANTIAFNAGDGVRVEEMAGTGVRISGNSLHENAGKGIENINGGNGELASPVITAVGSASGTACPNCTVEVFSDSADEGRVYEGTVLADGGGNWTFPGAVTGPNVTATARDAGGNTSEFSPPFAAPTPTPSPSPTPTPTPTPTPPVSATPTSTPSPTGTGTVTPTTTPTPTPTASPTGTANGLTQGDVDCTGDVTSVDALKELRDIVDLAYTQNEPCPDIGDDVASIWGDVDCSGEVTSVDALKILRYVAGLPVSQNEPCPDIGDPEGG